MKTKKKIREIVKEAWNTLCLYSREFGADSEITNNARTRWAILDDLWNNLYVERW